MWYVYIVYSCSENWRTNIKFSRLTLYFYIPGHTWTDWKIGANHIFQKYKLDRKLLREIEGYFTVKLIVCLLRWCLLRIVTLPSWMRSTVEMFLTKIYFGSFLWSFSDGFYLFPQILVSANMYKYTKKVMPVFRKYLSKQRIGNYAWLDIISEYCTFQGYPTKNTADLTRGGGRLVGILLTSGIH